MMTSRRGKTIDIVVDPSSSAKEQVLDSAGHCLPRDTPPLAIAIVPRGDMEQLIHIDKLSERGQDRLDARTGKRSPYSLNLAHFDLHVRLELHIGDVPSHLRKAYRNEDFRQI